MEESVALRPKMYSYFRDEWLSGKKNIKCTKKCVIKRKIKFQDYKEYLEKNKTILKQQQRFRSESHNAFIEKVNNIALSKNNDKRIQSPDGFILYPYDTGHRRTCKNN